MNSIDGFLDTLGLSEEPYVVYYTESKPVAGIQPKSSLLPSAAAEQQGAVDWQAIQNAWSCVLGKLWIARKIKTLAYFDKEHFGCPGGAFYLGFFKPMMDSVAHFISMGEPGGRPGEKYLSSYQTARNFFHTVAPEPASASFCVMEPISQYARSEPPELVVFFARPEAMAGLHQLATFVTGDFEAVRSPRGSGCSGFVTWPRKFLAQGQEKACIGSWDPSCRPYLKTDELTFTVPWKMFEKMLAQYGDSFLKTKTWQTVRKKISRSARAWGENQRE